MNVRLYLKRKFATFAPQSDPDIPKYRTVCLVTSVRTPRKHARVLNDREDGGVNCE